MYGCANTQRAARAYGIGRQAVILHRLSQVFYLDVPRHPRPVMLSDMMVTIEPTLEGQVDRAERDRIRPSQGIAELKGGTSPASTPVKPKMRALQRTPFLPSQRQGVSCCRLLRSHHCRSSSAPP